MKILAIIPARGGSKRIPRKNIKSFFGKPMITWPIGVALKSEIFHEVMVSTEDKEIADISKKAGAEIPFMRSVKNSGDMAGTEEVILEVLSEYKKLNRLFDFVCCIYPSTPLMTADRLVESRDKIINGKFDSLIPVVRFGHPVQRALRNKDNKVQMVWPENMDVRTQDLEPYFHDAGQYYWLNVKKFEADKKIFSANSGFIELSEMEAQDIDNMEDWNLAELKFRKAGKLE
jgi:N-acylneuraminate cytidylyltransferase